VYYLNDQNSGLRTLVNALNTFRADGSNSTYIAVRDAWRNLGWSLDKLDELGGRNNGQLSNNFDADDTGAAVEEIPAMGS